jgi:AcrR family transcriptional regulator
MNEPDLRRRVLEQASLQFVKYGYAKVTTGEIAGAAGISKKTLYKLFPSKEELFRATALMHLNEIKGKFDALTKQPRRGLIDKLYASMQVLVGKILEIGDFLKERPGSLTRVYDEIMKQRQDIIVGFYRRLFKEGVKGGSINRRVDENAFILILVTLVQSLFSPESLTGLRMSTLDLFTCVAHTLLEGVLSEQGRRELIRKPLVAGLSGGGEAYA